MITALLVLALAAAPAAPAARQPAAKQPETADVKKAKDLFVWAQKLYKQARYAEAIAKFEEAYLVRPHPVIYFNIGRCYEQLNETAKALRAYKDYLRLAPEAEDRETVSDAMANLERRLKEKGLQQLMVYSEPPGARIEVDGKEVGSSPASAELVAGNHKLTVKAEGFETVERSFVMNTARSMEMTISLRPVGKEGPAPAAATAPPGATATAAPPPPPPPVPAPAASSELKHAEAPTDALVAPPLTVVEETKPRRGRVFTWVAGAIAVAGVGTGVGLGLAANGAAADLHASVHSHAVVQGDYDSAQTMALGANVGYGVAAGAAVAAVVLFFLEPH